MISTNEPLETQYEFVMVVMLLFCGLSSQRQWNMGFDCQTSKRIWNDVDTEPSLQTFLGDQKSANIKEVDRLDVAASAFLVVLGTMCFPKST